MLLETLRQGMVTTLKAACSSSKSSTAILDVLTGTNSSG